MKTTKLISQLSRNLIGIIMIAFILASCNKDELFPASSSTPSSPTIEQAPAAVTPVSLSYEVIAINHFAARTFFPDYKVAVYADGNVIFEGRRNTAFKGTKNFKIDERTFSMLQEMFSASHLFDVPGAAGLIAGNELADVPEVFTTFNNDGNHAITLRDYNDHHAMPELIRLRTSAEDLLNIDYLISNSESYNH